MRDGTCRPLDPVLTPQVLAGYFLGLSPQELGKADPIAIADFVIDFAATGLRTRR
jgi:hypothetical protein